MLDDTGTIIEWAVVPEVSTKRADQFWDKQQTIRGALPKDTGIVFPRALRHNAAKIISVSRDRLDGNVALTIENRHHRYDLANIPPPAYIATYRQAPAKLNPEW